VHLIECGAKFFRRADIRTQKIAGGEHPRGDPGIGQVIKNMPAVATLDNQTVRSKDGKLLRYSRVSEPKSVGQTINVYLAVSAEFFQDADAVGMGESAE
jgi:hypothetical protein